MEKSGSSMYPALRLIAGWYKTVGYVVTGILVISGLIVAFKDGLSLTVFAFTVGGLVAFAVFVSIAEIIQLILDTERNTRSSAYYLEQLVELQAGQKGNGNGERAAPSGAPPSPASPPKSSATKRKPVTPRPKPAPVKPTPAQAESIRKLVQHLHADGLSPGQIVKELTEEGIQTLTGSGQWDEKAVHDVLSSASS